MSSAPFKIPKPAVGNTKKDPFQNREFHEQVNPRVLDDLIHSKALRDEWVTEDEHSPRFQNYANEREHLLAIQSNILTRSRERGLQRTLYARNSIGVGRVYSQKSLSIGTLRKAIRHTIARDYYTDIDMVNAHPTIALHHFQNHGHELPALHEQVQNRDEIINQMPTDRSTSKELFIAILYGGTPEAWATRHNITLTDLPPSIREFINNFQRDALFISTTISDANPQLREKFNDRPNSRASITALFFQDYERRILETLFRSLCLSKLIPFARTHNLNVYNAVLCYDGLMIPTASAPPELLKPTLRRAEQTIKQVYGIPISLVTKPMDQVIPEDELKTTITPEPEPLPFTPFNHLTMLARRTFAEGDEPTDEQLRTAHNNSYDAMRDYWEDQFFVTQSPVGIARVAPDGVEMLSNNSVETLSLNITLPPLKGSKTIPFFSRWITDPHRRTYERVDFYPPPLKVPQRIQNTFRPFAITEQPATHALAVAIPPLYKRHLELLTGNDLPSYEFLINYLAHLVQKPGKQPLISILFKSVQGVGKNVFFNAFGNLLLGNNYYKEVDSPEKIFSNFSYIRDQLLVVMDEASGKDTFRYADQMKALITGDKIHINEKYKPAYSINNCVHLIIFSNNSTPIKIDPTDRRQVAFECSPEHANDHSQFHPLITALHDRTQMRQFYDFLLARNITDWDPQQHRPITSLYRELQSVNVPPIHLFLADLLDTRYHGDTEIPILNKTLYRNFCDYCDSNNLALSNGRPTISIKQFSIQVNRLAGVTKKHTKHGVKQFINPAELRPSLEVPPPVNYDEVPEIEDEEDEINAPASPVAQGGAPPLGHLLPDDAFDDDDDE